ncbi:MAG TPA: neutral/alkaline non-lysosomal ceramidase N-terminal domain-containing protein [Pirellulales bacterium]|nr:neutral/alkaline non-lysosomal ceramidase N-terminal domain-containing protein [Pirellulales bacterium]
MNPLFLLRTCGLSAIVSLTWQFCGQAYAAEAEWKVGVASVKLTPDRPVPMAGYAARTKPFEQVEADIFAKAMALEDAEGHRAVLVTSDLIGFRAAVAEGICARLSEKMGLKREQILLNSSHSHAGPALAITPKSDDAESLRTVEYTRKLQDHVVDVVVQALARMRPARLSAGQGVVDFPMNRREFRPTGVILGVNARGPADRSVPVLRVDSNDGSLQSVLFGAGTHNTTLGGDNFRLCGDYAGFAQQQVEEKLPGVTAMFMLGCAGDSNPYPRGTIALARQHGATLGNDVCRVLDTTLRPVRGPLRIAFGQAALPLEPLPPRDELQRRAAGKTRYHPAGAQGLLAMLNKGETPPSEYTCPFTVWQFGDDLTLVALPGEVVIDYLLMLEKALGPNQLWVIAYSNDVFGYLPSARVLEEGGYETRGITAGGSGYFAPAAQDVVVSYVRQLAQQAGRKALP